MRPSRSPTKTVDRSEFREQFEQLLDQVTNDDIELTIEENGQPVAVLKPIKAEEQRTFDEWLELIRHRANLSGDEADQLAKEAVEAVRARTD